MTKKDFQIKTISLTDIKPSKNNPREIDIEGTEILEKSINTFGLVEPILINLKNNANTIISGHQRYNILLKQNQENLKDTLYLIQFGDIGWVFKDTELNITEDEETQLQIMLNNHQGHYNKNQLKDIINKLELKGIDTTLTGFKKVQLEKLKEKPKLKKPKKEKQKQKEQFKKTITCPECGNKIET